jgi:oligosaccharide repeat unit polymerase
MVKLVGFLAFGSMLISVHTVYLISKKLNFAVTFTILAYLFSFGQSMLYAFGYQLSEKSAFSIINGYFSTDTFYQSSLFALCAIGLTSLGICCINEKKINEIKGRPHFFNEKKMVQLGWLLMLISVFPKFYCLYLDIITTFTSSYGATIQDYQGIAKIYSLISGFFVSAIIILICFETSQKKRLIMWGIIGTYLILELAGGSRISIVRLGIMILLLWKIYFKNINRKRRFQIILGIIVALFALSLISATRIYFNNAENIAGLLSKSALSLLRENYFLKIISEMGNSQIVNLLVLKNCPVNSPFQYGLSYLKMISAIFPSLPGVQNTNYIGIDITFSALYPLTTAPMGATYIAEAFWNFGWFSLPVFTLLGFFIGKISVKFYELSNMENSNAEKMFIIAYLMYYMIFIVRGELLGFGRSFVWYALIPVFMNKISLGYHDVNLYKYESIKKLGKRNL